MFPSFCQGENTTDKSVPTIGSILSSGRLKLSIGLKALDFYLILSIDNPGRSYLNGSMEKEQTLSDRERELLEEIQEFNRERDRIRKVIGEIGGTRYSRRDTIINIAFLTVILLLFISEVLTMWLPTFISIEVGILLVSIKIVWMIHAQQKYNHFVFWVLNSIEFRQNDMAMKLRSIEKRLETITAQSQELTPSSHSPLGNTPP